MSDRLKKSIGRLFEKKLDPQPAGLAHYRNEPKLQLERSAFAAAVLESPTHAKSQNSVALTTSSNNPVHDSSPKTRPAKQKPATSEADLQRHSSLLNRTCGSNSNKLKQSLKKLSGLHKHFELSCKPYSPAAHLKRAVSPIQLTSKLKDPPSHHQTAKDDAPGIRLRLNTLSQSRLAQSTFQQPIKACNVKLPTKTPVQLTASVFNLRNRLPISPSSSVSQESFRACRRIKGSEREIRLKLSELSRKIEAKMEKRFERLERELRELKKEIFRSVARSFEQCMESLQAGADLDFELQYRKLDLPSGKAEFAALLDPLFRLEKLAIKIEPLPPARLSFEEYAAENLAKAGPAQGCLGMTSTVEASFTKFFENNSKLDFIDYVDPETFFQQKKNPSFLQDRDKGDALSETERETATENNFFHTTFKHQ